MKHATSSAAPSAARPAPDAHAELVHALLDPGCYPHPAAHIEHIETHISDVLLTGQHAYKLKKPLALGFLDFSTLAKRHFFCCEELRLNRRLAPELYEDVVAITGTPAHPSVGGPGEPIEYALRMRQFDQSGLLERVLARGELTAAHVDQIAASVAAFHAALPAAAPESGFGSAERIMRPALQNFEQLLPLLAGGDGALLDELRAWTSNQHAALAPLFDRRMREGCVRECHGDLHLGNMALIDGRVRIFDCIEFSADLRWIDVVSEAAFLAMDLLQHRRPDLAFRFLNRYLELTGDYAGVRLLRYYMVYRALVRAKVAALRAAQSDVAPADRQSLQAKCRAHLALAHQLATSEQPALLILHGLSGSGKTALSQTVLQAIGAIRIRSDVERKRLHGIGETDRSGSAVGGGIYTAAAGAATYQHVAEMAAHAIEAGFPVLVDAAFLERTRRDHFRDVASRLGCPFAILHAEAPDAVLRARIAQRASAARDASEATAAILDRQIAVQDPLSADELVQCTVFPTDRMNDADVARQAHALLEHLAPRAPGNHGPQPRGGLI